MCLIYGAPVTKKYATFIMAIFLNVNEQNGGGTKCSFTFKSYDYN
jgi:hypothetical protein